MINKEVHFIENSNSEESPLQNEKEYDNFIENKTPLYGVNYKPTNIKNNYYSTTKGEEISFLIDENTTKFDLYKGLLFMLISCIFRSCFAFMSKWSLSHNKDLTSFQQITFFNFFYFSITIFSLFFTNVNVFSEAFIKNHKFGLIFLRNVLAISSNMILTYSLRLMHISDVFSVFFIYPAFVIIFSIYILNEKSWWFDYICFISCFIGAILIVKPEFIFHQKTADPQYYIYFILVFIAAILKACEDVTTRFIGKDIHFQAINLVFSVMGMLVAPIIVIQTDIHIPIITNQEYFVFFLTGISAWLYQTFAFMAFQNENAGRASMINYLQVDFMYIIDLAYFKKPLMYLDLVGTLLIFSFNFANGLYKTFKRISILNEELEFYKVNSFKDFEISDNSK